MISGKLKQAFVIGLMVSVCAWTMAFVFSALAGESLNGTLKKAERRMNPDREKITAEKVVELAGIEVIKVETASNDIVVQPGDVAAMKVEFQGMSEEKDPIEIVSEKGVLTVKLKRKEKNAIHWNISWEDDDSAPMYGFRLTVPRSFNKEMIVQTASGDTRVEDMNLKDLSVKTASGDVRLERTLVASGVIESVNGDIEAQSVRGNLSAKNVSGDIEMSECTDGELNAETVSGDVSLKAFDGPASGHTVSGDIEAKPKTADGWRLKISTLSGDKEIGLTEDSNSSKMLNFSTTSGDIRVLR